MIESLGSVERIKSIKLLQTVPNDGDLQLFSPIGILRLGISR